VKLRSNCVLERCESTNDYARKLALEGCPHGTWISCRVQSCGKGRSGRTWQSLEGNLFLSILVRMEQGVFAKAGSWVPLAAAAGAVRALRSLYPELGIQIKWPNDLWLDDAKLGGILCESVSRTPGPCVIVGIGLNYEAAPSELATGEFPASYRAICLKNAVPRVSPGIDLVRDQIVGAILGEMEFLRRSEVQTVRDHYLEHALMKEGTQIEWTTRSGTVGQGTVAGLGAAGELLVDLPARARLFSEDVRVRVVPKANGESRL